MAYPERANVALQFVIVGGGVAGLAVAYALTKAGHEVIVLEKTDGNGSAGDGVRCPPNMTRVFNQWGLKQALNEIAVLCKRINWYSGKKADLLGCLVVEDFLVDVATDFGIIQHGRLVSFLKELAKKAGVDLRFNSRVLGADPDTGHVFLENGDQIYGDIIIAADGYTSILRPIVVGEADEPTEEKTVVLAFTIPVTLIEGDAELQSLIDTSLWSYWIGPGYMVYGNTINDGRDYTVFITHQYDGDLEPGDWMPIDDINQFGINFDNFNFKIRKLLKHATTVNGRLVFSQLKADSLVCENSRIVLVGDAAHPIQQGGIHSQALGLEDAQTLGTLFSKLQTKDQVDQLLEAYNEIRQPWAAFAASYTYKHHAKLKIQSGPMQQARDKRMRAVMKNLEGEYMDEALFKEVWGNDLLLFANNAQEKVEDWWSKWGTTIVKNPNRQSLSAPVQIEVLMTNISLEGKETETLE